MATALASDTVGTLGFYVGVREGEFADLEVIASAAIAWAQSIKAAAAVLYPEQELRVSLIAAEPGSSRWLAKIEESKPNKVAEDIKAKWHRIPAVVQLTLGLAVAWPLTIKPTIEYYSEQIDGAAKALGLTDSEVGEAKKDAEKARKEPSVEGHQREIFKTLQRDPKITGAASGVPTGPNWKPPLIPSNQFAEADGLFVMQENPRIVERRTVPMTLDVLVVSPRLENRELTWVFRQEGLPPFTAVMRDKRFLAALDRAGIREQFRTRIPMKIRLETKQKRVGDDWRDVRGGRSVVEVLSPKVS